MLRRRPVTVYVKDENDEPTTASFVIRDQQGRVYPAQSKRLAPDFGFHPQIYRADGEQIILPPGKFTMTTRRGPEYLEQTREIEVGNQPMSISCKLERWVDPATNGWWSGDHHIHAAGCAHYSKPTEGVHAPDMMRHCLGEDLKIGANLTWGPCFDYQKQFFTGKDDPVSVYPYLLRYDVEVSGIWFASIRPLVFIAFKATDPRRRRLERSLAEALFKHIALGEKTRGGGRSSPYRLGSEGRRQGVAELSSASLRRYWC